MLQLDPSSTHMGYANMISISNNGQQITSTNYWETTSARKGLCFMSLNAGEIRLLLPDASLDLLPEMQTGKRITIEHSMSSSQCVDIVFEDGTDTPFFIALDKRQMDFKMKKGTKHPFAVWGSQGLLLPLEASITINS